MTRFWCIFKRRPEQAITIHDVQSAPAPSKAVEAETRETVGTFVSEIMKVERRSIELREVLAHKTLTMVRAGH